MTTAPRHSESAFEAVIGHRLPGNGHVAVARDVFDRDRTIFGKGGFRESERGTAFRVKADS